MCKCSYITRCIACPYWQPNESTRCYKGTEWGDCYRVIVKIFPQLLDQKNIFGHRITVPFDPHDAKYLDAITYSNYMYNFRKFANDLPDGVRVDVRKELDLTFDDDGNERIRKVKLWYLQTRRDFACADMIVGGWPSETNGTYA